MSNTNTEPLPPHLITKKIEMAKEALAKLDKSRADDRDDWLKVGMALNSISPDSSELLDTWTEWSRQSEKFQEGECERQWASFTPEGGLTLASLIKMSKEDEAAGSSLLQAPYGPPPLPASAAVPKPPKSLDCLIATASRRICGEKVGRWVYRDGDGKDVLWIVRFRLQNGDKSYRQFSKSGDGWTDGGIEKDCPLYRLPEILAADPAAPVYICEGEKAADKAASLGFIATTSCQGAQSPSKTDCTPLAGRNVIIVPDNDEPGRGYAAKLFALLSALEPLPTVRVLNLPGLPKGGDIVEFVNARAESTAEAIRSEIEALATMTPPVDLMEFHGSPVLIRLVDIPSVPLVWLWKNRIPRGKLTLLVGYAGLGKSLATCSIAAIVSKGRTWPDQLNSPPTRPGSVIILNYEDDPGDTIRPRLEAAGADLNKIIILPTVRRRDAKTGQIKDSLLNLERDIPALELAIQRTPDCKLIIIDPISAATGKTDNNDNSEVRGLLAPLAALAAKYKVAVILISHFNKTAGGPAINRAIGSVAFVAAARVALGVVKDKVDPRRRLMLPIKNNLGPDSHGLAYRIENSRVPDIPCIKWETVPCDTNIEEALSPQEFKPQSPKKDAAANWLSNLLSNGPLPAEDVFRQADKAGFKKDTVRRAAECLNIQPKKTAFDGPWIWALPAETADHSSSK